MNPGGGGCREPRSCHCTPVWVTKAKLHLKKKKKKRKFGHSYSGKTMGRHREKMAPYKPRKKVTEETDSTEEVLDLGLSASRAKRKK